MSTDKVSTIHPTKVSPEKILKTALQMNLKEVIVLGFDKDGEYVSLNSQMSRKDALWIIMKELREIPF